MNILELFEILFKQFLLFLNDNNYKISDHNPRILLGYGYENPTPIMGGVCESRGMAKVI